MLTNGDKLIVTKKVASFLDKGDIVEVVDVSENGMISFAFGEGFMHKGIMNSAECEEHFKKVVNKAKATTITQELIDEIIDNSEFVTDTLFGKCTVVACQLPNGFVIVESSACVSPENYDYKIGEEICMKKIKDKVWEFEGYRLQEELYREKMNEEHPYPCCCGDCGDCLCDEDEEDEDDDCDSNCDYCEDYGCIFNTNIFMK